MAIARQNQVKIRALVDPSFAFRPYSEALDLLGVSLPQSNATSTNPASKACKVEPNNRVWSQPLSSVGSPTLPPGDLLHHKFAVIDQAVVIMGSHNWSAAANRLNDETLVAIAHPTVAAHYQREFERLYATSRLGLPQRIQEKWQAFQTQCPQVWASAQSDDADGSRLVNVNTATQAELESLPGIGPKTAAAIIQARQTQSFSSLEALNRVPGIGEKTLDAMRDRLEW